jgi:mono/diheme cytochrome c family protein
LITVAVACALASAIFGGCAQSTNSGQDSSANRGDARGAAGESRSAVAAEETLLGQTVFAQNCAGCHGATGEGGVGPSLKNEKSRKNYAAAVTWIKEPPPPMPKLYPGTLGEKDVDNVAAYVESL